MSVQRRGESARISGHQAGVGIYPAEPRVEDSTDRGSLTGRRTETLTYVFERAGMISIPDIAFTWWNVADERLETLTLPGRELDIKPGPASSTEPTAPARGAARGADPWLLGGALLIGALLLRLAPSLARRLRAWYRSRQESEARYFRRAVASVRSGDSRRALRDIMRWLDRFDDRQEPAQLRELVRRYGPEAGGAPAEELLQAAGDGRPLADPRALAALLREMRKRRRGVQRRSSAACALPDLNGGCRGAAGP